MEFLVNATSFLLHFLECFLAIFIYDVIKMQAERNISFFQFMFCPESYYLSFIYKESRNLRLEGMSVQEVQEKILEKFNNNSLPFLLSPTNKKKNLDAISLTKASVENLELFSEYVCTPNFGKSSVKKLKQILMTKEGGDEGNNGNDDDHEPSDCSMSEIQKIVEEYQEVQPVDKVVETMNIETEHIQPKVVVSVPISEDEKDAKLAVMSMMNDDLPNLAKRCMLWLRDMCCHPIPDPDDPQRGISDGEIGASLFYALVLPKHKNHREDGVVYYFKTVSFQRFVDCIEKLKKVYPEMNDLQFSSKSNITHHSIHVLKSKSRLQAIREDFEKNVLQLSK